MRTYADHSLVGSSLVLNPLCVTGEHENSDIPHLMHTKFIGGRAAHFCRGDGWSDAEAHGRNEKTAASIRVSNYH